MGEMCTPKTPLVVLEFFFSPPNDEKIQRLSHEEQSPVLGQTFQ